MALKRSRPASSRLPPARRRRSARLLALAKADSPQYHLLDLPDETLTQIFHYLLNARPASVGCVPDNVFANLRHAFALASTSSHLRTVFYSSLHTFDATFICAPFTHSPSACQCRVPGHVCISPASAILNHAAPTLHTLAIPDVLPTTILNPISHNCLNLRQLSFTDDGLFMAPASPALHSLKYVLKLPRLNSLVVQTPTVHLLSELANCHTNLQHLNLYDANEELIPHIVKFLQRSTQHALQSLMVVFGYDNDNNMDMYTSSFFSNQVEVMNSSSHSNWTREHRLHLFVSTACHYLKKIPFKTLYTTVLDQDLQFGRCDQPSQHPRHNLVRMGARYRCSSFYDSSPDMKEVDIRRPVCRVSIFNTDHNIRHLNSFIKHIEPPLPFDNLYTIWHNPCATIRFSTRSNLLLTNTYPSTPSSNSNNRSNSNSLTPNRNHSKVNSSSMNSSSLALVGSPNQRTNNSRIDPYVAPTREAIQAEDVLCTQLRRLITQCCECDIWRFEEIPYLHALEITLFCIVCVQREQHSYNRVIRILKSASTSLKRIHLNWLDRRLINAKSFQVVNHVLSDCNLKLNMLDVSLTFLVTAIDKREMAGILSKLGHLKVLHIGCCAYLASMVSSHPCCAAAAAASTSAAASQSDNGSRGSVVGSNNHGIRPGSNSPLKLPPAKLANCPTSTNNSLARFVSVMPRLLKLLGRECEQLIRIDLHVDQHRMNFFKKSEATQFVKVCRVALRQLDDFQRSMPQVDVCSLRTQLMKWNDDAIRRYEGWV